MSVYSKLYRAARVANTAHAIVNPTRLPRRAKNIALGRLLSGVFARLWR